ncbi:unnamed protein product [Bursaphelenchus xylophilus]|uniref:(pine wood nematode) hypothetical protein n=1 Tax=Bursaphelenchus xylophilus TaxID=6326 RepID=A0A1I7SU08_BURXY|nr:unnamed protein product [Bursaphelenchus xylophilus]CAG9107719.1 unnamed protein product [Bursaphelenchus xylophilus]
MKVLDWLCGCDAPNRDESAAYLADTKSAGDLPQKKPVVLCTDQPRSDCPVVPLKTQLQATLEGKETRKGNDANETSKTDIKFPLPEQREMMKPLSVITFSSIEHSVNAYRELCQNVNNVLSDRVRRMETLLEDETGLPEEVEDDIRLARGKMMVIMKNNLTKFSKLVDVAEDTEQGIADLTGFWGLVHAELEDIKRACGRVEAARLNAWQAVPRPSPPTSRTPAMKRVQTANKSGTSTPTNRTPKPTPKTNPKLREFMAQKRKEMQDSMVNGEPQTVA